MAYKDQADLSQDADFQRRLAACGSVEIDLTQHPMSWASDHQWDVAASPGFADAYASAVAGGVPHPGADPSVISDAQILSAVQTLFPPEP
jgi:hypothetical protein